MAQHIYMYVLLVATGYTGLVPGSIPGVTSSVLLLSLEQESLLTMLQSAVTSISTWCKLGGQITNCPCLA